MQTILPKGQYPTYLRTSSLLCVTFIVLIYNSGMDSFVFPTFFNKNFGKESRWPSHSYHTEYFYCPKWFYRVKKGGGQKCVCCFFLVADETASQYSTIIHHGICQNAAASNDPACQYCQKSKIFDSSKVSQNGMKRRLPKILSSEQFVSISRGFIFVMLLIVK